MDLHRLQTFLTTKGEPGYRFHQITKNIYSGRYQNFDQMTDLPLDLRRSLTSAFSFSTVTLSRQTSDRGTTKALLSLSDGLTIETVLMDYAGWLTACVSCQVGCPMACSFCATGRMGFKRQLTADEIVDQVLYWNRSVYPRYVGRVVFMGMGEPFLNWPNVSQAISRLNSKDQLNIGSRKISLSTAGVIEGINHLASLKSQINLAVSLHAADQAVRQSIMPVAKQNPLPDLLTACQNYTRTTRRQIFFEYALINRLNDTPESISKLIRFLKTDPLFFLNLISLNPIAGSLVPSPLSVSQSITARLTAAGVPFSVRRVFGRDIDAACGQLASGTIPHAY